MLRPRIDTVTPKNRRSIENDPKLKKEPVWDPQAHPGSWRAVWAYSAKRAARDGKTLTAQENRARAVVDGEKAAKAPTVREDHQRNEDAGRGVAGAGSPAGRIEGLRHQHPRGGDARG